MIIDDAKRSEKLITNHAGGNDANPARETAKQLSRLRSSELVKTLTAGLAGMSCCVIFMPGQQDKRWRFNHPPPGSLG